MTDHIAREKAEQARLLLQNDVFAEALTEMRMDALLALAEIDPADVTGILRQQAIVEVTGQIKGWLEVKATIAAGHMDGGYTNSPDGE